MPARNHTYDAERGNVGLDELLELNYEEPRMTPLEWMMSGDTGTSSKTILSVMEGIQIERPDVPHDPADFGRCHRLLEAFPVYRYRMNEVAEKYPAWVGLVREWDKLTDMYVASKASGQWEAPSLYDAMQLLIDEGRIADGWTRTGPGSWSRGENRSVSIGKERIEF